MDIGYHIVRKQPHVLEFYNASLKDRKKAFSDYFQNLRKAFPDIDPINYRGISRLPLLPVPEALKASWGVIEEPKAQFLLEVKIEETCLRLNDDEIDMLGSLDDTFEVFDLIENKERFEVLRVSLMAMESTSETIGYDVGYWGGDNFSAISDSVLLPIWHPAQPSSFEQLQPFARMLNQNHLFSSFEAARSFRKFYLAQDWAETETSENQICVQKVDLVPSNKGF